VFYFRILIPLHLRPYFAGKKYLKKTTETSNKIDATHRARQLRCYCHDLFLTLEADMKKRRRSESPKTITTGLVTGPFGDIDFGGDSCPKGRKKEIKLPNKQLKFAKQNPELAKAAMAAIVAARTQVDTTTTQTPAPAPAPASTHTFDQIISEIIEHERLRVDSRENGIKVSTFRDKLPRLEFWKCVLSSLSPSSIDRAKIKTIRKTLMNLPAKAKISHGLSSNEAYELAKSRHTLKVISATTFNHYGREFKAILEYCFQEGIHDSNLVAFFTLRSDKVKESIKFPFSDSDMATLTNPAKFKPMLGNDNKSTPLIAKFWIPLIAAYSGMRLEEIAQLTPEDIITDPETGIEYFNLIDGTRADGNRQEIKNDNSRRAVPIHSKLYEMGISEFIVGRRKLPKSNLFGLSLMTGNNQYGRNITKWFSIKANSENRKGYIEKLGIISTGVNRDGMPWSKSFHSLRHTVIDNLRGKSLPSGQRIGEAEIGLVAGHTELVDGRKLETSNYGVGKMQLKLRHEIVEQICYSASLIATPEY